MLDKIVHFVYDHLVSNILKIIGIIMVLTILIQIFARSFMKLPFPWTEELARITFIWFCLLGSTITLRKNTHLGIDFFYLKFSKKTQKYIDIFVILVIIFFGLILSYYGYKLTVLSSIQKSPVLRASMSWFYAVLPITGGLYTFLGIYNIVKKFKKTEITD